MKNALKLFITDLKRVAKTPGVWVILAGLAILPSFYAWFNLWAMWDPYGHTGHIKVAVVNEDQGEKVRGKNINVAIKCKYQFSPFIKRRNRRINSIKFFLSV